MERTELKFLYASVMAQSTPHIAAPKLVESPGKPEQEAVLVCKEKGNTSSDQPTLLLQSTTFRLVRFWEECYLKHVNIKTHIGSGLRNKRKGRKGSVRTKNELKVASTHLRRADVLLNEICRRRMGEVGEEKRVHLISSALSEAVVVLRRRKNGVSRNFTSRLSAEQTPHSRGSAAA